MKENRTFLKYQQIYVFDGNSEIVAHVRSKINVKLYDIVTSRKVRGDEAVKIIMMEY